MAKPNTFTEFDVGVVILRGIKGLTWTGSVGEAFNDPEGSGQDINIVLGALPIPAAGSAVVLGSNFDGELIQAVWLESQLQEGLPAFSKVPPAYVAYQATPSVPILQANEPARKFVSFDSVISTVTVPFTVRPVIDQELKGIQSIDTDDSPNFKMKPDANAYSSDVGQGQGEISLKIQLLDTSDELDAFLRGMTRRYRSNPSSIKRQISSITYTGTVGATDRAIAVIDGIEVTAVASAASPAGLATALATAITAAAIPSLTSAVAQGPTVTLTGDPGVGFDFYGSGTTSSGDYPAFTVKLATAQTTDYEYVVLKTSERPYVSLIYRTLTKQTRKVRTREFGKVKPTTISEKSQLADYTTIDTEFMVIMDANEEVYKNY